MTRTQSALYRVRHGLWTLAVVLFVGGAAAVAWLLVDRAELADRLEREANLRGAAVSTLAGDVRALRAQVEGDGGVPVAPDPTQAVEDLPDRAEVPVPIPGPRGADGQPGASGEPGKDGEDGAVGEPGAVGPSGAVGPAGPPGPQGAPGPAGPQGERGADGADGADGEDGQSCPDGYSLQAPSWDPDALVCRRDGAPAPEPEPEPGNGNGGQSGLLALDPTRRQTCEGAFGYHPEGSALDPPGRNSNETTVADRLRGGGHLRSYRGRPLLQKPLVHRPIPGPQVTTRPPHQRPDLLVDDRSRPHGAAGQGGGHDPRVVRSPLRRRAGTQSGIGSSGTRPNRRR